MYVYISTIGDSIELRTLLRNAFEHIRYCETPTTQQPMTGELHYMTYIAKNVMQSYNFVICHVMKLPKQFNSCDLTQRPIS